MWSRGDLFTICLPKNVNNTPLNATEDMTIPPEDSPAPIQHHLVHTDADYQFSRAARQAGECVLTPRAHGIRLRDENTIHRPTPFAQGKVGTPMNGHVWQILNFSHDIEAKNISFELFHAIFEARVGRTADHFDRLCLQYRRRFFVPDVTPRTRGHPDCSTRMPISANSCDTALHPGQIPPLSWEILHDKLSFMLPCHRGNPDLAAYSRDEGRLIDPSPNRSSDRHHHEYQKYPHRPLPCVESKDQADDEEHLENDTLSLCTTRTTLNGTTPHHCLAKPWQPRPPGLSL